MALLLVLLVGNAPHVFSQTSMDLTTIQISSDTVIQVWDNAKMYQTPKDTPIEEVLKNLSGFKSFSQTDLELDPEGNADYWFVFSLQSDRAPLYLSLPLLQNFDIALYFLDADGANLVSKGGILTPISEKFINHGSELFDLTHTAGHTVVYLVKINRMIYKAFSARIFTANTFIGLQHKNGIVEGILYGIIFCVVLYHILIFLIVRESEFLLFSIYMAFLLVQVMGYSGFLNVLFYIEPPEWNHIIYNLMPSFSAIFSLWFSYVFLGINQKTYPKTSSIFKAFQVIFLVSIVFALFQVPVWERLTIMVSGLAVVFLFFVGIMRWKEDFRPAWIYLLAYLPTWISVFYLLFYSLGYLEYSWFTHNNLLLSIVLQAIIFSLAIAEKMRMLKADKALLLERENFKLEEMVKIRTTELQDEKEKVEATLQHLKATQDQLVQQEKLASLGQLTAGIAHEIKNPLNFVNNFSELSMDLLDEVFDTMNQEGSTLQQKALMVENLQDVKGNLAKIHQHGRRADGIVKSMLAHSRGGSGLKEKTAINALVTEYTHLAFHGMRAGKKSINVSISMNLDPKLGKVPVIEEDFTRIILNICGNAFDAMYEKVNSPNSQEAYQPKLTVSTIDGGDHFQLRIEDNGPGIPPALQSKILEPFFTTKKGTEGTGLGLSITHDIVKAHQGTMEWQVEDGKSTCFIITLPKI